MEGLRHVEPLRQDADGSLAGWLDSDKRARACEVTYRMRAAVFDRYGSPDVLQVTEVARPEPDGNELLIRLQAGTVNRSDCAFRRGQPFIQRAISGWRRPKMRVLGNEYAGTVAEVGPDVSRFAVGDEVFGVRAYLSEGFGAHAEYLAVRETSAVARKPPNVSFEEAAASCDGALCALPFLRKSGATTGSTVLVYGASGAIGSAAVQLGRHMEQFRADAHMHRIAEKLLPSTRPRSGTGRHRSRWRAGRPASWRCRCSSTRPSSATACSIGIRLVSAS